MWNRRKIWSLKLQLPKRNQRDQPPSDPDQYDCALQLCLGQAIPQLAAFCGGKALATEQVLGEFGKGVYQSIIPATSLNWLKRLKLRGPKERALFTQMRLRLGEGEASSLAIAVSRGYSFLTDDMKARRVAQTAGVTVSGSVGVLLELIRTRKLALGEGNNVLRAFIRHGYFSPVERLDEFFQ